MADQIVPTTQLRGSRMPEMGRLRMGEKHGKAMRAIPEWRLTSAHKGVIEQAAEVFGGECVPWNDTKANPPNQWQVYTTTKELPVILPPDAVDVGYEEWTGGGRSKVCDGITVEIAGREGATEAPCICMRKGVFSCKPTTRLKVILPDLELSGVWRFESKGWNAAKELAGMTDLLAAIQPDTQLATARLVITHREQMQNGKKKKFQVPMLHLNTTARELASGVGGMTALAVAPDADRPQLEAGPGKEPEAAELVAEAFDGDIVDAEIIEDDGGVTLYDNARDAPAGSKVVKDRESGKWRVAD